MAEAAPHVNLLKPHTVVQPQRGSCGAVEAVAPDGQGGLLILGWIAADLPDLLPLAPTPLGDAKALHLGRFSRAGLAPDATGFLGFIKGYGALPAQSLRLALSGQPWLSIADTGPRRLNLAGFLAVLKASLPAALDGKLLAMAQNLDANQAASKARILPKPEIEIGLDGVVMIAGLGCVLEGWAYSHAQEVTDFTLTYGDLALLPDPRASYRRARPDLSPSLPQAPSLWRDAGFSLFFPCAEIGLRQADLALELRTPDGSGAQVKILAQNQLWLHRAAGEEAILRAYPALEHEVFFTDLAQCLREVRFKPTGIHLWHMPKMAKALVLALGPAPHETYRIAADLAECAATGDLAQDCGIILAGSVEARASLLAMVDDLRALGLDPGLAFLRDPIWPAALSNLLTLCGAQSFLLIREGFRPCFGQNQSALAPALAALAAPVPGLQSFALARGQIALRPGEGPGALAGARHALAQACAAPMAWADLDYVQADGIHLARSLEPIAFPPLRQRLARKGHWL